MRLDWEAFAPQSALRNSIISNSPVSGVSDHVCDLDRNQGAYTG